MRTLTVLGASASVAAILLAGSAGAAPADGDHRADAVLADARTMATISVMIGVGPTRCVASDPETSLCEWELGSRQSGWKPIADALQTDDRVRLLCELPAEGSPRAPGSCTAHVQRSQRDRWRVSPFASDRGEQVAANRRSAVALLEQARTLVELSRLVGGAPHMCAPKNADEQICMWRVTSRNHGHAALATSIGAPLGKKLRMHCVLPTDGSPRGWESCAVEVGA